MQKTLLDRYLFLHQKYCSWNSNSILEFNWTPKGNTSWWTLCKYAIIGQWNDSATIQQSFICCDPILLGASLPFPLVRVHSLRYKPGLLPSTSLYLFLCFGSWPSPYLLHFPHPARRSLGCLWNGSSVGPLWDVTEESRSVAPSPLCSCRVPSGSVNSGLALLVLRLFVCVFVWEGKWS